MTISTLYRKKLEQLRGEQTQIRNQIQLTKQSIITSKHKQFLYEQAREIVKEVGLKTQQQLQYQIGDIASMALNAIFPDDPYELKVEFVQRRNKTECDLLFVRDGQEVDPISSSGGGAVDVAAFALRIASWSMQRPRTMPVIILDEPMRFLSEDRQEFASRVIEELSKRLNLQFIIVTHEPVLTLHADRVFEVSKGGKSKQSKVKISV